MKWSSIFSASIIAVYSSTWAVQSHEVLSIHGSGTTNPSKCIWMMMQRFMDRAKLPLHLTYRAVGSSTGQYEFLGVNNTGVNAYVPYNYFGSGDIPIPTNTYNELQSRNIEIVHLPFVIGAITLFHNVPGVPEGPDGLNLTSCLVAKIFKREITIWDDEEILNVNPNLKNLLPSSNFPIKVARRVLGSSSTASVTEYLNVGCPEEWSADMVGSTISWHPDTMECEGSEEMTSCIRDNEGAIGYIDAGHGHEEGLIEIELKNADGNYISSKRAAENGGIGDAAGGTPGDAKENFGEVKLLNKPGAFTWPIVAMSYIYARTDLSFIEEPAEQSLLKTFLQYSLFDEEEIEYCSQFGFVPVPEAVRQVALNGIAALSVNASAPKWEIETETLPGVGQGDYVISTKRRTYDDYQRSALADSALQEGDVKTIVDSHLSSNGVLGGAMQSQSTASASGRFYTEDDAAQLQAALVLASISFAMWVLAIIFFIARRMMGKA